MLRYSYSVKPTLVLLFVQDTIADACDTSVSQLEKKQGLKIVSYSDTYPT